MLAWRSRWVVTALGLGIAAAGVLGTLRPAPPETRPVVVAGLPLVAGTRLTADDVRVVDVPTRLAADGAAARVDEVLDRSLAVDLTPGSPLVPGVLAADGATGPPGTVVTTVRLADTGAAAMLEPGRRVDVLAATPEGGPATVVAARALVLPPPAAPGPEATAGLGTALAADADHPPPVLLAVTPEESLALAGAAASSVLSAVVVP
ncbi:SAF domain protein [Cellulomonas fimi ATCC 484]|uniref:SAF domain protein n=1 Tax=Cellulomonas fimi (strain ATCC 484 / DSM 20113 / JCM 1341 / CCUG 24087 / LMG 16345 / NBRC 15513 / NCIMB 8980 / NCTC 7547 / NRS-133) TaxID=590998 RepID=F4GZ95_CELFA|nr:SAF domain protein [Cellulomonas fimi ATCC 484]VEH35601.1 Flp pilus assembly protein CpaB [Cellulomonas fimi]